jgi:hypothetical protein
MNGYVLAPEAIQVLTVAGYAIGILLGLYVFVVLLSELAAQFLSGLRF